METIKVKCLVSIGDSEQGCLNVSGEDIGHIGRITFSIPPKLQGFNLNVNDVLPSPTRPAPPMPMCKSPKKSAEEMLKKALEFANQCMEDSDCNNYEAFADGKYVAYEDIAAYLEMLIKEARQNG